jgi:hypothetical protein
MSANKTVTWRRSPSIADRALRTFSARCFGVYEAIERVGWPATTGPGAVSARRQVVTARAAETGPGAQRGAATRTACFETRAALVAELIGLRILGLARRASHPESPPASAILHDGPAGRVPGHRRPRSCA